MSAGRKPTQRQIKAAADRIRNEFPVRWKEDSGKQLDAQIAAQNHAIRDQLEAWGLTWSTVNNYGSVVEGRNVWFTTITARPDGSTQLGGRWSDNEVECELHSRMYTEFADVPAGHIEVFEDADTTVYNTLKSRQIATERAVRAIERKQERTHAKYTDTTTTTEVLAASVEDGMLF